MSLIIDRNNATRTAITVTYANNAVVGQSVIGNGMELTELVVTGFRQFDAPHAGIEGTMKAHIFAHSGTYGTSSVGTGDPLTTSTTELNMINVSRRGDFDSSSPVDRMRFRFPAGFSLEEDTNYVIGVEIFSTNGSGDATYNILGFSVSDNVHAGNLCQRISGTWSYNNGYDLQFELYGKPKTPIVGNKYALPSCTLS